MIDKLMERLKEIDKALEELVNNYKEVLGRKNECLFLIQELQKEEVPSANEPADVQEEQEEQKAV